MATAPTSAELGQRDYLGGEDESPSRQRRRDHARHGAASLAPRFRLSSRHGGPYRRGGSRRLLVRVAAAQATQVIVSASARAACAASRRDESGGQEHGHRPALGAVEWRCCTGRRCCLDQGGPPGLARGEGTFASAVTMQSAQWTSRTGQVWQSTSITGSTSSSSLRSVEQHAMGDHRQRPAHMPPRVKLPEPTAQTVAPSRQCQPSGIRSAHAGDPGDVR